jgi:methyl-accepting chemotaxis protein
MTDATDDIRLRSASALRKPFEKTKSIRHQLLLCFLIIAVVSLGVGCALWVDLGNGSGWDGQGLPGHSGVFWGTLSFRIATGIVLILAAAGFALYRLHGMIARPLEKTSAAVGRMAEGNLSETIPAFACDEIDRVGESVNGLAVNFQEALILVWNQTENAIARIQRTTRQLAPNKTMDDAAKIVADLISARQDLETMQMMVRSFDLYDVTINEGDVLTAKEKVEMLN